MSQLNLTKQAAANNPADGKTAIYVTSGGNLATRSSTGDVHEYSPTPLESEGMVYGVKWDRVNDEMTAGIIVSGSFVATDYQNFPVQERCIRGHLTGAGVWTPLHPYDTTKNTDGTSATIDGSTGQVMVQVPRHYQLVTKSGNYDYFLISEQPFSFNSASAWVPPAFLDKSHFYIGAFQGVALSDAADADVGSCVLDTSAYNTNANPNPFANRDITQFRTQCAATGDVFSQMSLGQYDTMYMLALIEYKTWALQEVLEGNTEYGAWNYDDAQAAGATVGLGNFSGSIWSETESKYIANSYRGVENVFGNVWQFADGANLNTDDTGSTLQRLWTCYDPDDFASDTDTDYTDTGCAPDFDDEDDYVKDVFASGKYCPLFPIDLSGATSSTFITDYTYTAALGSGWRVVHVGGQLTYGRIAGFGCRILNSDSSNDSASIGARLGAYV